MLVCGNPREFSRVHMRKFDEGFVDSRQVKGTTSVFETCNLYLKYDFTWNWKQPCPQESNIYIYCFDK